MIICKRRNVNTSINQCLEHKNTPRACTRKSINKYMKETTINTRLTNTQFNIHITSKCWSLQCAHTHVLKHWSSKLCAAIQNKWLYFSSTLMQRHNHSAKRVHQMKPQYMMEGSACLWALRILENNFVALLFIPLCTIARIALCCEGSSLASAWFSFLHPIGCCCLSYS